MKYFISKKDNSKRGYIHTENCPGLPWPSEREFLGEHDSIEGAIQVAFDWGYIPFKCTCV